MTLKVAFYKGKGDIIDKLVRFWTNSKYSHTELVIQNDNMNSYWITSHNECNGVRVIENRLINKDDWDFILIDNVTNENIQKINQLLKPELGKKYDYLGIFLSQVIPIEIDNPDKWFCSEIVSYLLKNSGIKDIKVVLNYHPQYYNPGNLFDRLIKYYKKVNYDNK